MSDNAPITEELRDAMQRYDNFDGTSRVVLGESNFDRLCDAIDATYANLERENAKLRELSARLMRAVQDDAGSLTLDEFEELEGMANELGVEVGE